MQTFIVPSQTPAFQALEILLRRSVSSLRASPMTPQHRTLPVDCQEDCGLWSQARPWAEFQCVSLGIILRPLSCLHSNTSKMSWLPPHPSHRGKCGLRVPCVLLLIRQEQHPHRAWHLSTSPYQACSRGVTQYEALIGSPQATWCPRSRFHRAARSSTESGEDSLLRMGGMLSLQVSAGSGRI